MNIEDIEPVGDRYLIEPYKSADQTASGLSMENSSNASAAPVLGKILRVGEKAQFNEGDLVLFERYSLSDLKVVTPDGEKTFNLVEGENIAAVIKSKTITSNNIQ